MSQTIDLEQTLTPPRKRMIERLLQEKHDLIEKLGTNQDTIDDLTDKLDDAKARKKALTADVNKCIDDIEQLLLGNHIERLDFDAPADPGKPVAPPPAKSGIEAIDAMTITDLLSGHDVFKHLKALNKARMQTGRDLRLWCAAANPKSIKGVSAQDRENLCTFIQEWIARFDAESTSAKAMVEKGIEEIRDRAKPAEETRSAGYMINKLNAAIAERIEVGQVEDTPENREKLMRTIVLATEPQQPTEATAEIIDSWIERLESLGGQTVKAIIHPKPNEPPPAILIEPPAGLVEACNARLNIGGHPNTPENQCKLITAVIRANEPIPLKDSPEEELAIIRQRIEGLSGRRVNDIIKGPQQPKSK